MKLHFVWLINNMNGCIIYVIIFFILKQEVMYMKRILQVCKKIIAVTLSAMLLVGCMALTSSVQFVAHAQGLTLNDLKEKFPQGEYWNHVVTGYDNYADVLMDEWNNSYADCHTSTRCETHKGQPEIGKTDCNVFAGSMQCCGFAKKLGYDIYESVCTEWETTTDKDRIKPGDIIHYYGDGADPKNGHWVFVTGVDGDALSVGECNMGEELCMINWERVIYKGNISVKNIYVAPYELPIVPPETPEYYFNYEESGNSITIYDVDRSLKHVVIPAYINDKPVTTLARRSFGGVGDYYNAALESVVIPETVRTIGVEAFLYCENLKSVQINNGVTAIKDKAFEHCDSLTSITIPGSVKSIGIGAFEFCRSLESVDIEEGVTSIGEFAFYGCRSLKEIVIPEGVTCIDVKVFSCCYNLVSVTIPDTVEEIKQEAFGDCNSIASINIPQSVTNIGKYAFNGSGITRIDVDKNNTVYSSYDGVLYSKNQNTLIQFPMGKTGTWYIPETLTYIMKDAISGTVKVSSIEVDENNENYFSKDGVLFIKYGLLDTNTELVQYPGGKHGKYIIPNSITSIGAEAFYGCTGLTSVSIPDSVKSIGAWSFDGCTGLANVTISNGVTSIGEGSFRGCTAIKNVTLPESVESIGKLAFSYCSGLDNVTLPESVESIGEAAFFNCSGLDSVIIKGNVKTIENESFCECTNLTSIVVPASLEIIGNYAFYNTGLTFADIPENVSSIGSYAFYGCKNMKKVQIPESVESIGAYAFGFFKKYENSWDSEMIEGFTIIGKKESSAESYAKSNSITFVDIDSIVEVSKVTLDKTTAAIAPGESLTLKATISPSDATDKTVTWSTSNSNIATVADGVVTAVSEGTCKITAKTENGKKAVCTITVRQPLPPLENTSYLNSHEVQIGDDIRINGCAKGGTGKYTYAFYFKRAENSKWNKIGTEFGTKTYGITVPKAAAYYDLKVIVKDSEGNTAEKTFRAVSYASLKLTNISYLSAYDVKVGKTVTAAGRQVGGTKPFTYEFYFKRSANSKWNKLSYGNAAGTYAKFTPTAATSYDIKVVVIDSAGTKASKIMTVTAQS